MKSLKLELPDRLAEQVERLVRDGWFQSEDELVRVALVEFLRTRQAELQERFQREISLGQLRKPNRKLNDALGRGHGPGTSPG